MFDNKYKIFDNYVEIYMHNKKEGVIKTVIDLDDLEKIIKMGMKWYAAWRPNCGSYCARTTKYLGIFNGKPKSKSIDLHRVIMNADLKYVDHINHDTLDNRKNNLRVVQNKDNSKHRKGKNSNNKSGYRNVCWVNSRKKWVVQLQISGKNKVLGTFNDLEKANAFAI